MTNMLMARVACLQLANGDIDKANEYVDFVTDGGTIEGEATAPAKPKRTRRTKAQIEAEKAAKEAAEKAEAEKQAAIEKAEAEALADASNAGTTTESTTEANPFDDEPPAETTETPTVTHDQIRQFAGVVMKAGVQRPDIVKAINDAGAGKIEELTGGQLADCMERLEALKASAEGGTGGL